MAATMIYLLLPLLVACGATEAASQAIYVNGCDKSTCQKTKVAKHLSSDAMVKSIQHINNSPECPNKCTSIVTATTPMHVYGHWLDLSCRAWGGNFCRWGYKDPKFIGEAIERSIEAE